MLAIETIARELRETLQEGEAFCRLSYQRQSYLVPIAVREDIALEDLLDIDAQKVAVLDNLTAFLHGKSYNHMLLWGARGTGKSSLIRAGFHHFKSEGLKLLQISCDDLQELGFFLWVLGQQSTHFLVYIDDLSFADNDDSYRALKAVLDGSIAGIAPNIMLCVTSNRRHLLSELHRAEEAIHPEEDVEEQISLAERFGLRLAFHPLSQKQYLSVIAHYCARSGVKYSDTLARQALQFSLARGSRSARVAEQFVRQLHA